VVTVLINVGVLDGVKVAVITGVDVVVLDGVKVAVLAGVNVPVLDGEYAGVDAGAQFDGVIAASQFLTWVPWHAVGVKPLQLESRHGPASVLKFHAIAL
jgi:hypothetical protein